MDRMPFIVLVVVAVFFAQNNNVAKTLPADSSMGNLPTNQWETGLPSFFDALANGFSLFGQLTAAAADQLLTHATHGTAMLISETVGGKRVNMGTRGFSDRFGPNSVTHGLVPSANPAPATPGTAGSTPPAASTPSSPSAGASP